MAALAAALFASAAPASAGRTETHIYTKNETKVWAWVTAYTIVGNPEIQGAWCVGPGQYDEHGLHAMITDVRFEITKNHACAHPVLADTSKSVRKTSSGPHFTIREEHGHFVILDR